MDFNILMSMFNEGTPLAMALMFAYLWSNESKRSNKKDEDLDRKDDEIDSLRRIKDEMQSTRIKEMREVMQERHEHYNRIDTLSSILKDAIEATVALRAHEN